MSKVRTYARSLLANWIGYAANVVVVFFLSPFVVHSLGNATYGVWSLLMTVTGYLGLVELGVRISTGRYINYYLGRGELQKVSSVVNTSLAFYTGVGFVGLAIAAGLGLVFGTVFAKVPVQLAAQARWVLLLMAVNVWLGCIASTYGQLLRSKDRFDLVNGAAFLALAVRAGGTVWVLSAGYGIVALAAVQVASNAVAGASLVGMNLWKGQKFRFGARYVSRSTIREVFGFGIWAFVGNASLRIIYYTDAIVIGLLLGSEQITYYSIGFMLIDYGRHFIGHVTSVMTPDILKAGGAEDLASLRWLISKALQVSMFLAVPLLVGLAVLGGEFVSLWMGKEYGLAANWVILILALSHLWSVAALPFASALMGLGEVEFRAWQTGVEAFANLCLSVALVLLTPLGIVGIALGTAIPVIGASGTWQTLYTCRRIKLPIRTYFQKFTLKWVFAALVFLVLCQTARTYWPSSSWRHFVMKVALLGASYLPVGWFLVIDAEQRRGLVRKVTRKDALPIGENISETQGDGAKG